MISFPEGMTIFRVGTGRNGLDWMALRDEINALPVGTRVRECGTDHNWIKRETCWENPKTKERATPFPVWISALVEHIPHELTENEFTRQSAMASFRISTKFLMQDLSTRGRGDAVKEIERLRKAVEDALCSP